jgi:hypothetical protein
MRHLSRDQRLALVESADGRTHPHLQECARCRADVEDARALLREVRLASVPEPSPLFWDHLSARVSAQVASVPAAPRRSRMAWGVLVPLAVGVTAMVLAVAIDRGPARPKPIPMETAATFVQSVSAPGDAGADASWSLLGDMAGEFDVDTLSDSLGTPESAGAEVAVYQLSAWERAKLADLLRSEMGSDHAE